MHLMQIMMMGPVEKTDDDDEAPVFRFFSSPSHADFCLCLCVPVNHHHHHHLHLQERAFTQMHTRREDVYRNFEKPFNKWIIRNAWLLHMNYPRHVKHLLMAHEMHKLHFKEKKLVRDLISAQEVRIWVSPTVALL